MAWPAWSRPVPEVLEHHGTSVERGLPTASLEALRQKHGYNELQKMPATPLWKLILEQFNDTLVKVPPPPPTCRLPAACRPTCRRQNCRCFHPCADPGLTSRAWQPEQNRSMCPPVGSQIAAHPLARRSCCWRPPCRLAWRLWRMTRRSRACGPSWSLLSL